MTDSNNNVVGGMGELDGWEAHSYISNWFARPSSGSVHLKFISDSKDCEPLICNCTGDDWAYEGVSFEGYDYRRKESGASWFFPPIRSFGQYHDEETDLFENWNRYYDPATGRYLAPEPLLQNPRYVASMAKEGMQIPAYAFAGNNPLRFVDVTGLDINVDPDMGDTYSAMKGRLNPIEQGILKAFETDPSKNIHITHGMNITGHFSATCGGFSTPRGEGFQQCSEKKHNTKGYDKDHTQPDRDVDVLLDLNLIANLAKTPGCTSYANKGYDPATVLYHELFGHVFPDTTWRGWPQNQKEKDAEEASAGAKSDAFAGRK